MGSISAFEDVQQKLQGWEHGMRKMSRYRKKIQPNLPFWQKHLEVPMGLELLSKVDSSPILMDV